ncbi:MAG: DUF2750 domain-containing protein [Bacteroidota bacterium]
MSKKELLHVSNLSAKKRYDYFIKKVADYEVLYSLKLPDGNWAIGEAENNNFFMLWPNKEATQQFIDEQWTECVPFEIPYSNFIDELINYIEKEKFLLNIFSVKQKTGFVVSTNELIRDMNLELEKYG